MLEVQKYLLDKTLDDLHAELGIEINRHSELPLVILNYNQIESPKTHPIVRECRALTLDSRDYTLVSRSFPRFFNWGEVAEEMKLFNFGKCFANDKEDGSLVKFYNFEDKWFVNTRGSWGVDVMPGSPLENSVTWRDVVEMAVGPVQKLGLDPDLTYVTELCSPYNKVVRRYAEPKVYLLTIFKGEQELGSEMVDYLKPSKMLRPKVYYFNEISSVMDHIKETSVLDNSYEGVVLCDDGFRRWKVKSPTYLALHAMWGNGNLFLPQYLLPFILAGEGDELLTYYPEVGATFKAYKQRVEDAWLKLLSVWEKYWQIENQKEFALAIKHETPFTGILFQLRKDHGVLQTVELLKSAWRANEGSLLKILFNK
jgi:hypothetical protein